MTENPRIHIGCSGLPTGLRRERFFEKLDFLECPETFSDAPSLKALRGWRKKGASGQFGIVADKGLTEFRTNDLSRELVATVAAQVEALEASLVVFRTGANVSRSAEDRMRRFFSELASETALGGATRVWEPGELWELSAAKPLAEELGLVLAVDPLAQSRLGGSAPRPVDELSRERPAYLRLRGLGRSKSRFREDELEELVDVVSEFPEAWVVFANADKNRDAGTFRGLVDASR